MKLYELSGAYNDIFQMLESEDVNFQALEDTLQAIEGAAEQKIGGIAKIIKSLEVMAAGFATEAKRLSEKQRTTENRIKWLKEYILSAMEAMAKDKVQTDIGTVRKQKNPTSITVKSEPDIPEVYWLPQPPKLDKAGIMADLKEGHIIPGVSVKQGYHIRIQ